MLKAFYTKVIRFGPDDTLNIESRKTSDNRVAARICRKGYYNLLKQYSDSRLPLPILDPDVEIKDKTKKSAA